MAWRPRRSPPSEGAPGVASLGKQPLLLPYIPLLHTHRAKVRGERRHAHFQHWTDRQKTDAAIPAVASECCGDRQGPTAGGLPRSVFVLTPHPTEPTAREHSPPGCPLLDDLPARKQFSKSRCRPVAWWAAGSVSVSASQHLKAPLREGKGPGRDPHRWGPAQCSAPAGITATRSAHSPPSHGVR